MTDPRIPSIAAIQRTNVIVIAFLAAFLTYLVSFQTALGCLFGGTVVVGNLFVLAAVGKLVLAVAAGGATTWRIRLAAIVFPLKLLVLAGLVYLLFAHAKIDGAGFAVGILTQLIATIIETGRAWLRATPRHAAMEI